MYLYYNENGIKKINTITGDVTTLTANFPGVLITTESKLIILGSSETIYKVYNYSGELLNSGGISLYHADSYGYAYVAPYIYISSNFKFRRLTFNDATNTIDNNELLENKNTYNITYNGTYLLVNFEEDGLKIYNPSDMSIVRHWTETRGTERYWSEALYGDYYYACDAYTSIVHLYKYKENFNLLSTPIYINSFSAQNNSSFFGLIIYSGYLYCGFNRYFINPDKSLTKVDNLYEFSTDAMPRTHFYRYRLTPLCFGSDTKIDLACGTKLITDVVKGDVLKDGTVINSILAMDIKDYEMVKFEAGKYELMESIILTKKHKCVNVDGTTICAGDLEGGKLIKYSGMVYNIVTDEEKIITCNGMKLLTVGGL